MTMSSASSAMGAYSRGLTNICSSRMGAYSNRSFLRGRRNSRIYDNAVLMISLKHINRYIYNI